MTRKHPLYSSRIISIRAHLLAAVVSMVLTMPPSEAQAEIYYGDESKSEEFGLLGAAFVIGGVGLAVFDVLDFGSGSQPSFKNAAWDLAFGIPCSLFASSVMTELGETSRDVSDVIGAVCFGGAGLVLMGHGIWEIGRMGEGESAPREEAAAEPAASLSWTPVLLNREGDMGLGVVGRF